MEKGKDPLTGETFIKRRHNQVFASRENQVAFNNRKAREKRKAKAISSRALDRNRDILKRLHDTEGDKWYSRDYLLGAGLQFGYTTHRIQQKGMLYNFVHDYGFVEDKKTGKLKIIKYGKTH